MTTKIPVYFNDESLAILKSIYGEKVAISPTINNLVQQLEVYLKAGFKPLTPHSNIPLAMMGEYIVAGLPGFPSPAADYVQDRIDLNDLLIWHRAATHFGVLGPEANSMLNKGFKPGDMVIWDAAIEPRNGDIVMAIVNNAHTLKELVIGTEADPKLPWLRASNPEYDDIHFKPGDEFSIFGTVTFNVSSTYKGFKASRRK